MNKGSGRTCCGISVLTLTPVVALIGCVLGISGAIYSFTQGNIGVGLNGLFGALIYLLVFYGQYKRKPSLFLWFLIIMGIILILAAVFIVWAFVNFLNITDAELAEKKKTRGHLLAALLILISALVVQSCIYIIIFKAYKELKETL